MTGAAAVFSSLCAAPAAGGRAGRRRAGCLAAGVVALVLAMVPAAQAAEPVQLAQAAAQPPANAAPAQPAAPAGGSGADASVAAPFSMQPSTDLPPAAKAPAPSGGPGDELVPPVQVANPPPGSQDFVPTRDGDFVPPSGGDGKTSFGMGGGSDLPPPAAPAGNRPAATPARPAGDELPPPVGVPSGQTAAGASQAPIPFDLPAGSAQPTAQAVSPDAARYINRYLLPRPDVRLTGEADSIGLPIYLTQAEAAQQARISIGFINSVVVMPEVSRLTVWINGKRTIEVPVEAVDEPSYFQLPLPRGLLRPGLNQIRISTLMRHRVDCSIAGTFELWTQIVPEMTGLTFTGGAPRLSRISDLPAVGADSVGATRIMAVRTGKGDPVAIGRLIKAAQSVALAGRFSHPVISVVDSMAAIKPGPGTMALVVGQAADVMPITPIGGLDGANGPVMALMSDPATSIPVMVLSGRTNGDADAAIDRIGALVQRDIAQRLTDGSAPWRAPDVPLYTGGESYTFRELGVPTEEFSGRRFKTSFEFRLPPDFYAEGYGYVQLRLDAAYSPEVLAGSTISFYINDQIAMTFNLTSSAGEFMQQRLITVPMANFRAGVNTMRMEANLNTESDRVCLPGTTMAANKRFVLFNTSRLIIPRFARLGVLPNLAAFSADGFPYGRSVEQPLAVYVPGGLPAAGAAATLVAQMAVSRGEPLAVVAATAAAQIEQRPALVVSAAQDIDPTILARVGIGELAVNMGDRSPLPDDSGGTGADAGLNGLPPPVQSHGFDALLSKVQVARGQRAQTQPAASAPAAPPDMPADDTAAIYERWQSGSSGFQSIGSVFVSVLSWLNEGIGINARILGAGFMNRQQMPFTESFTAMLAQNFAERSGLTTWTVLTAATNNDLASGAEGITAPQTWRLLAGQTASFLQSNGTVRTTPPQRERVLETVPFSLMNWRLIAANWFSLHIVGYAAVLILASIALGVATWIMIHQTRKGDMW